MGWTDDLKSKASGFGSVQGQAQIADPLNIIGLSGTPNQPGVPGVGTGPAKDPSILQPTQNGQFYDPTTGTTYADANGTTVVAAPNTAQQVAGATGNSQSILGRNGVQDARSAGAYNGQKAFGEDLNQVIRNPNAPTVSTSVMNQALGNIDRQQLSGIAGEGGANAASARRHALDTMGTLDLQAAGAGAVARAQEATGARQAQATNLQNMAGNANEATGINTSAAGAFSNQALQGSIANQNTLTEQQKINAGVDTGNMQQKQGFLGDAAGGAMKAFA